MLKKLEREIGNLQKDNTEVAQLTVRISKGHRKTLRRLAARAKLKEGPMLRVLVQWAIEVYAQSSQRTDISKEPLVSSERLEILEQISLLGDELAKFREQVGLTRQVDSCTTCPVLNEVASLKAFLQQERGEYPREYSDGPLLNIITGLEKVKK